MCKLRLGARYGVLILGTISGHVSVAWVSGRSSIKNVFQHTLRP